MDSFFMIILDNCFFRAGANGRMFPALFLLFFLAVVECRGASKKETGQCAIYPKDPVIPLGDDIQVMFKAPDGSFCRDVPSYRPEELFWMLNEKKLDEDMYTMVNSTIPAVTIRNFTLKSGMVTCLINVGGKNIVLGGTNIKVFMRPVKPANVSCITVLPKSFTCSWDVGDDPLPDTTYTVSRKTYDFSGNVNDITTHTTKSNSWTFDALMTRTEVWVTANSSLGRVESDVLNLMDIFSTVKTDPPVKVVAVPLFDSAELKVTWEQPNLSLLKDFDFVYEVQYSYQQGDSRQKHVKTSTEPKLHINVERQCTRYSISVRCALNYEWTPLWSDWSPAITVISPIAVQSMHLQLWRKIRRADDAGNRTVELMWKGVPSSCDAINGYKLTLKAKNNNTEVMLCSPADSNASVIVDKQEYSVSIVAYRDDKVFSEDAIIIIPAAGVEELPVDAAQVCSYNDQIHVRWSAPSQSPTAYMVDWSADDENYSFQETETTNITFSGQPLKQYNITVTPLYDTKPGQETRLPSRRPGAGMIKSVNVEEETTRALVSWAVVPYEDWCGFTVNYTVLYSTDAGPGQSIMVDSGLKEVLLDRLQPGTNYKVRVMASSVAGEENSINTVFTTLYYGSSFITMLGLFSGFGIVLLLMIGLWCFIMCKKHILKSVPNPKDSEAVSWPPQYCQKPLLMPFKESCSENLSISSFDVAAPKPIPPEETLPLSPDRLANPASDVGPDPMKFSQGGQCLEESRPLSPYTKNCIQSVNGRVYPCDDRKPAPSLERDRGTSPDSKPLWFPTLVQAYVSAEMIRDGQICPIG
ncbi:hypothetical protein GJAV_G00042600 [Gymnothorax javanicus]|nr:hypothetical protein GJAV_G00042600 [Gymnothorax javanicus]